MNKFVGKYGDVYIVVSVTDVIKPRMGVVINNIECIRDLNYRNFKLSINEVQTASLLVFKRKCGNYFVMKSKSLKFDKQLSELKVLETKLTNLNKLKDKL